MHAGIDEWVNQRINEWKVGYTNGWVDEWMDG